jgi:hypothetical protein
MVKLVLLVCMAAVGLTQNPRDSNNSSNVYEKPQLLGRWDISFGSPAVIVSR